MAFSKSGVRLGRGKGLYDKLLAKYPNSIKVGICSSVNLYDKLLSRITRYTYGLCSHRERKFKNTLKLQTMDISINVGYFGPHISEDKDLIKKLDDIGVSCVWTAEAYGFDAVTPLAYFSALTEKMNIGSGIMQIPARTPAMTAMTAVTLDQMSKGRFRLGLGVSGPQVVEGWHGVPYGKPLKKTREYVELVRKLLAGMEKLNIMAIIMIYL